jgi:predicted nucleic acid-binding protein
MIIVADASFLVAAFARADEHNPAAWKWWCKWDVTIIASRLAIFEAENTLRGFPVGGKCSPMAARTALEHLRSALLQGLIEERDIASRRLLPSARRLSQFHTTDCTYGAMDILHVATALDLKATIFLSFDSRQRELAEAEGLKCLP